MDYRGGIKIVYISRIYPLFHYNNETIVPRHLHIVFKPTGYIYVIYIVVGFILAVATVGSAALVEAGSLAYIAPLASSLACKKTDSRQARMCQR